MAMAQVWESREARRPGQRREEEEKRPADAASEERERERERPATVRIEPVLALLSWAVLEVGIFFFFFFFWGLLFFFFFFFFDVRDAKRENLDPTIETARLEMEMKKEKERG